RRRLVPGGRDADPLVARKLVEEGQEQGPPVEASRIVAHREVVAMKRRVDRPARPDRIGLEARQGLALLRQVLRVLEDLAAPALLVEPVALEVRLALAGGGGREDRQAPGSPDRRHALGHRQEEYTLRPGILYVSAGAPAPAICSSRDCPPDTPMAPGAP